MDSARWLQLQRTVRFGDTDAAGVMHFHQLLRWCHEAYEESLERFGIPARSIFPMPSWARDSAQPDPSAPPSADEALSLLAPAQTATAGRQLPPVALPIVHCSADFRRPLVCGAHLAIQLEPRRLDPGCFEVHYRFNCDGATVAEGLTRHLAITGDTRQRCPLPEAINRWLEASSLGLGVRPL